MSVTSITSVNWGGLHYCEYVGVLTSLHIQLGCFRRHFMGCQVLFPASLFPLSFMIMTCLFHMLFHARCSSSENG
eukprot:jgi/Botrbrau1/13481/Bobra.0082s0077.1